MKPFAFYVARLALAAVLLAGCEAQSAGPAATAPPSAPSAVAAPTAAAATLAPPTVAAPLPPVASPANTTSAPPTQAATLPPVASTASPASATSAPPTSAPQASAAPTSAPPATDATPPAAGAACAPAPPISAGPTDTVVALAPPPAAGAPPLNRYELTLDLNRAAATVTGTTTVTFYNRTGQPLSDLVFHLFPNLPDFAGELKVGCVAVEGQPVTAALEDGGWLLRVPLAAPMTGVGPLRVDMQFVTRTPTDAGDTAYGAFNAEGAVWTLASFYPILAVRVGDAWDTLRPNGWGDYVFSEDSEYRLAITADAADGLLVATGAQEGACDRPRCTVIVRAGSQRDVTLAQLRGWQQLRAQAGPTTVISSFPPEQAAVGQRALELSADAIQKYSEHFGPYPYTEFDIFPIAAHTFAGVEYPGMTMIGSAYYERPDDPRLDLQDVVVHEVAHQWWYNIVGNDILRESWLDEGITSYTAEYLYTEWSGQPLELTANRTASLARRGLINTPIDLGVNEYRVGGRVCRGDLRPRAAVHGRAAP